jgi:uncharacterized protein (DUF2267 family)
MAESGTRTITTRIETDQATQEILRLVDMHGDLPGKVTPADAVAAVMCVLSERLSGGESRHLMEEIPPALRTLLHHCGLHPENAEPFDFETFLHRLSRHLDVDMAEAETVANDVFAAVKIHLSAAEITHIRRQLPKDFGDFWNASLPGRKRGAAGSTLEPGPAELIREIGYRVDLPDHVTPADATAAVMCALVQRITSGSPGTAFEEVPPFLRSLMIPCTIHPELPEDRQDIEGFVRRVSRHLNLEESAAEELARGVVAVLKDMLPGDEIDQVRERLQGDLADLWSEPLASEAGSTS